MKILVTIGIVVASLIALLLIVAAFTKKDYVIEREVVINKPKQEVFDYIKIMGNQKYYSKWVMMDPNAKMEYKGTDGTVGFSYTWDSENKNVGKGEQEILSITEGEKIETGLHFIKPFEGKAKANFITEAVSENQTKVKWGFSSSMPYPMNIMLLMMNMEKMLGDDLATGLANMKTVLEK